MNELNYASREASQRLVEAGIVLEAENKRLREALKGLLQEAIVLTDVYLSIFETYHDLKKRVEELEAENAVMRADIATALRINNPCGHTGFESFVCEICGYPDPRRVIAKLREKQAELREGRD